MTGNVNSWFRRYVGSDQTDCAAFTAFVLRREFGFDPPPPIVPDGIRARDAAIAALTRTHAYPITESVAESGDVVVMKHLGRRVGAHHVGIYVQGARVLHALPKLGVCLHKLDGAGGLATRGLELSGIYRLHRNSVPSDPPITSMTAPNGPLETGGHGGGD